jgi:hypothetical protein
MDLISPKGVPIMAKAKTPRTSKVTNNQVITMPEAGSVHTVRKASPASSSSADLAAQIRERAYQLYLERGSTPGNENEDWLRAEGEVLSGKNHQQTA